MASCAFSRPMLFETRRKLQPSVHEQKVQVQRLQFLNKSKNADAATPRVSTQAPATMRLPHLQLNAKDALKSREKLLMIERENRLILNRMRQIMREPKQLTHLDSSTVVPLQNLQMRRKNEDLKRITRENMRLMRKIFGTKEVSHVEKCESHFQFHQEQAQKIAKFANRWKTNALKKTAKKLVESSVTTLVKDWGGMDEPGAPARKPSSSSAYSMQKHKNRLAAPPV